ncbi:hypothetical protein HPC38_06905 [Pasteurellaceae bacterium HPA106]|uniref:DUF2301 domain-containing membrane protein n=1 Tax=Spirabiliibacterium pneumoniae TaxID=221400 RepID=UPI001AAC65C4|nr:DUF2301 domain-containing membrane protein [Spirabiliibacterium pneumoniae]MBE2896601.1 hypothetical protein [Spirabiliibacterium pneumoniae]
MADPHIKSPMDIGDYLTVILYRLGFFFAAGGIGLLTTSTYAHTGFLLLAIASTLCAGSLHIYLKKFRLILQFATWTGLILALLDLHTLALGAFFVTLGGLCFKEYFCFRVPLLNLQPLFLVLLWAAHTFTGLTISTILAALCGVLFFWLAIKKARMPLHFDIGDKCKYEV